MAWGSSPFTTQPKLTRSATGAMKEHNQTRGLPAAQGLYDPTREHDACGMGFGVNIRGEKSHDILRKGIEVLINLAHRGACGCDPETGDGAGILIQITHRFFARETARLGFAVPAEGHYAVGMAFLPSKNTSGSSAKAFWNAFCVKKA